MKTHSIISLPAVTYFPTDCFVQEVADYYKQKEADSKQKEVQEQPVRTSFEDVIVQYATVRLW